MHHGRQTLELPGSDPESQDLPHVQTAADPPRSKPGRSLPHPIEAARRGAINTPPGLAEQRSMPYARPKEV